MCLSLFVGYICRVKGSWLSSLGAESPIHDTIDEAHNCYNCCPRYMLDQVSNGPGGIILATHNLDSGNKE